MTKPLTLRKGDCAFHPHFGPLYIVDSFRDGSGKVFCGINGVDGVSYQGNASEFDRLLTREEFDAMLTHAVSSNGRRRKLLETLRSRYGTEIYNRLGRSVFP